MKRADGRPDGFTLIEVVGAVAIVGIVFLMLSTATFRGIVAEANARRLLEASLVADDALAEVEVQMLMSLPIEIDSEALGDIDGDGLAEYELVAEITPYNPSAELAPAGATSTGAPFLDSRPSSPGANSTDELTMQRVRIDVFRAREFADPDEDEFPLASRTAFILETATINLLAPSRGGSNPSSGGNQDSEGEGLGEEVGLSEEGLL